MPIYAYRCSNCGHTQDALQKMSDPVLTVCPACGEPTYVKQVTAAGFQLKGSGWYVTDFRGDGKAKASESGEGAKASGQGAENGGEKSAEAKSSGDAAPASNAKGGDGAKKAESAPAASPAPAASSPAPAASPASSSAKPGKTGT